MWKAELTTTINGSAEKAWEVLTTPKLWTQVDPEHYKEVIYSGDTLTAGTKGKMKAADSPYFSFKVDSIDETRREVVTKSSIPAGALIITKRIVPVVKGVTFEEEVVATGPFANLFAKLFFNKQIKATLPAQHQAIKDYVEKGAKTNA